MTGWRVYAITPEAILTAMPIGGPGSAMPYPTPLCQATCDHGHQPPAPGCECGAYFNDTTPNGRTVLCWYDFPGMRANAKVEPVGTVLLDPYVQHALARRVPAPYLAYRAAALRVVELWLPDPDHCTDCHQRTPHVPDDVMTALADRYAVPVHRLPPAG
jgi:hypothetical protein